MVEPGLMLTKPRQPSKATLKRYGLTLEDWTGMMKAQAWVCAICKKIPASGGLTIDHEHVYRWRYKPPERRKLYVRGVVCSYCNRVVLRKGMTVDKLKAAIKYLEAYEKRRPA